MTKTGLEGVFERLLAGATVVTINARLFRYMLEGFDRHMIATGALSWKSPSIMPIGPYLSSLWAQVDPAVPLLSSGQASALWDKAVGADESVDKRHARQAAKSSFEAYRLLSEYRIKMPEDDFYLSEEARALKRWQARYLKDVSRLGCIDNASLPARLSKAIRAKEFKAPDELILAGFDELTPALAYLLDRLTEAGAKVTFWPSEPGSLPLFEDVLGAVKAEVTSFEDELEEVVQASRWVRSVSGPGKRVGVIVPELSRYRPLIEKEFSEELDPASVLCGNQRRRTFNISLGTPLSDEPVVSAALRMISIGEGKAEIGAISSILLSPFFSSGEESFALAVLDARLKEKNCMAISLNDLKGFASSLAGLRGFIQRLSVWIELLKGARKQRTPGLWARYFSSILKDTGWGRGISFTSAEYQAMNAWNRVLEEFASLDDMLGRISRTEAAAKVSAMAAETIYQSESGPSGVEVLGLLEAVGQSFDCLWIMGCHQFALPAEPVPNPFIPLYLQKEHDIRRSSHESESRFAKRTLAGILKDAPSVIVSYPRMVDDKEVGVSPLFKGLPEKEVRINESSRLRDSVRLSSLLEDMPLDVRLPVAEDERGLIRGGTTILKNQSQCPFRAFAVHRLDSRCVNTPEPGVPPAERGSMLHEALRAFWDMAGDSARLKEMLAGGGLKKHLEAIVDDVLKGARRGSMFSGRFLEIERERLTTLLGDWLEKEAGRPSFTIKKVEDEKVVNLAGLKVTIKPDRVDMLEDSNVALIDYKSGKVDRNDWLGQRPRDPQMIIYSIYSDISPKAVTFARVATGECRFVGIAKDEGMLPGVKSLDKDNVWREGSGAPDWDGLMEMWRGVIESLAQDFVAGNVAVDPFGGPLGPKSVCRYCEQKILCRVAEAIPYGDGDGDDTDEGSDDFDGGGWKNG